MKLQARSCLAALALAQACTTEAAALAARNVRRVTTPRAKACTRTTAAVRVSAAATSAWIASPAALVTNDRAAAAAERAWIAQSADGDTRYRAPNTGDVLVAEDQINTARGCEFLLWGASKINRDPFRDGQNSIPPVFNDTGMFYHKTQ